MIGSYSSRSSTPSINLIDSLCIVERLRLSMVPASNYTGCVCVFWPGLTYFVRQQKRSYQTHSIIDRYPNSSTFLTQIKLFPPRFEKALVLLVMYDCILSGTTCPKRDEVSSLDARFKLLEKIVFACQHSEVNYLCPARPTSQRSFGKSTQYKRQRYSRSKFPVACALFSLRLNTVQSYYDR